jgi:hypothetical protein
MNEDFLANVQHEGEAEGEVFKSLDDIAEKDNQEKETPATPPVEDNQTENAPSSQGATQADNTENANSVPWHKDPRWQEWQEEKKQLLQFRDEVMPKLEALKPQEQVQVPEWFGGDEKAWNAYNADFQANLAKVKSETIAEYEAKQKAEADKVQQANEYVENQLGSLESQGKKFDRNELLKVVSDYRPITADGNWDFERAYEILEMKKLKESNPEKLQAKRDVAALTNSSSSGEPPAKTYFTPADFRGGNRFK